MGEREVGGGVGHAEQLRLARRQKNTTLSGIDAQEKNPQNLKPTLVPTELILGLYPARHLAGNAKNLRSGQKVFSSAYHVITPL